VRPQLPVTHNFAFLQHTPSKSLRVEIIDTTNLRTAHLSSYTLQKRPVTHHWPTSRTCCSSAVILLTGLLLIRVARPASFSSLAYISYALRVWPHSPPRRRTSRTCCTSGLILLTGLPLVRIARLASFFSLNFISYALLVCPHSSRWPTPPTGCSSAIILHAGLILLALLPVLLAIRVARLPLCAAVAALYFDEIWDVGLCIIMYI